MQIGKRVLLSLTALFCEDECDSFCMCLGYLVKRRFKSGCVKCFAENMGWRNLSGYKYFEVDVSQTDLKVGRSFLSAFIPNCDWCADVYSLNRGKGLYLRVYTHDSPTGESYYLTPIGQSTYERIKGASKC